MHGEHGSGSCAILVRSISRVQISVRACMGRVANLAEEQVRQASGGAIEDDHIVFGLSNVGLTAHTLLQ